MSTFWIAIFSFACPLWLGKTRKYINLLWNDILPTYCFIVHKVSGQFEGLCRTSSSQCNWPPWHCCLQVEWYCGATDIGDLIHWSESYMLRSGNVHSLFNLPFIYWIVQHVSDWTLFCICKKLHTCQMYTDNEGLRQQQLLAIIPKHHKHYLLPSKIKDSLSLIKSSLCQVSYFILLWLTRARFRQEGTF